jgi:hypothetical protein
MGSVRIAVAVGRNVVSLCRNAGYELRTVRASRSRACALTWLAPDSNECSPNSLRSLSLTENCIVRPLQQESSSLISSCSIDCSPSDPIHDPADRMRLDHSFSLEWILARDDNRSLGLPVPHRVLESLILTAASVCRARILIRLREKRRRNLRIDLQFVLFFRSRNLFEASEDDDI